MLATVNTVFAEWLVASLEDKGWSQSELARRANLSPAAISDVLSGRRDPGVEFCKGIASALKLPQSEVLRAAGLIDTEPDKDPTLYKIEVLYHTLKDKNNRDRALQFLEFLTQQEEKDDRSGGKPKRNK